MDLFTLRVSKDRLHPNFRHVLFGSTKEDRAVLEKWAEGFVDRDGKFVTEFQTTFNSSFWELYLFASLKDLECRVDLGFPRPDFLARKAGIEFAIEATIANNAAGKPGEWEGTPEAFLELEDRAPLVHEATLRLSSAVGSKYQKYEREYKDLRAVAGKPFVLAIAPFEQPFGRVQNSEAIFQLLYARTAIPYQVVDETQDGSPIVTGGKFIERSTVAKAPGTEISLGLFRERKMQGISAVLFSSVATWGKVRALSEDPNPHVYFETLRTNAYAPLPMHSITRRAEYEEHILDGLYVFHNPDALVPLPWEIFKGPMVTQVTWLPDELEPRVDSCHGVLIQRTVMTLNVPRDGA